ncbi:hypothetical protein D3C78_954620 [compost metagenome]
MITALERQHRTASGGGTYQLQGRLHRIGTGRATELDFRFASQGRRQQAEQVLHKLILDRRGQVQSVQRQFIGQDLLDRLDHHRVVVPQRQRAGTGQTVDKTPPFHVLDIKAPGAFERQRNTPWVAAGIGFLSALPGQQR